MKLISKIKRKANFPIEIDIITVDELKYKFGKEKCQQINLQIICLISLIGLSPFPHFCGKISGFCRNTFSANVK